LFRYHRFFRLDDKFFLPDWGACSERVKAMKRAGWLAPGPTMDGFIRRDDGCQGYGRTGGSAWTF
jgi:hypothetical protein